MMEKSSRDGEADSRLLTLNRAIPTTGYTWKYRITGTGISQNNIKKIFTPFFSSKSTSRHWGIGLSLTYRIIQAHEGKIEVHSVLGKGTSFQILLPKITQIFNEKRSFHGK